MFKKILTLLFLTLLLFSCSKKNKEAIISDVNDEEAVIAIYSEAIKALKSGDAFYAGTKFREVESLLPQTEWAAKASLMSAYSDYSRNSYSESVFGLERYIKNYPADVNIPYAHYLIAICYYEQILDEKKDLGPLLKAQEKFNFIKSTYPETDYATDLVYSNTILFSLQQTGNKIFEEWARNVGLMETLEEKPEIHSHSTNISSIRVDQEKIQMTM